MHYCNLYDLPGKLFDQYILHIQVDAFMISWTEPFTVLEVMTLSNLNRVLLLQ